MKSKHEPAAPEALAPAEGDALIELLLEGSPPASARIDGVVVGRLRAFDPKTPEAPAHVVWPGCSSSEGVAARVFTPLDEAQVGREVALLFEGGDPRRPVVLGVMFGGAAPSAAVVTPSPACAPDVIVDGERLVLSADREIELRCGEASITLTRAGKILIRGEYVLTHASGLNRIQGGAVKIN